MSRPKGLPQLDGAVLVTDSGLETDLIFHHDVDLPAFAAFTLLRDAHGRELLEQYFREHLETAAAHGFGVVLETPTWRASPAWAQPTGWSVADVVRANREAFDLVAAVCDAHRSSAPGRPTPWVLSGCAGPRGDGYVVSERMTGQQARVYHQPQVEAFAETDVDLVSLLTATYPQEALGFVQAAADAGVPAVASFTLEVDGRLPDGSTLGDAITEVDEATDGYAAYFMVNCAHPQHIAPALDPTAPWASRLVGLRANASTRSHAELDEATELDDGDPVALAAELVGLRDAMPAISVLGGCCGTDVRHIEALAAALSG
jgi:S-methylmethionine-dependent homocysteine/selenocysteine methylase